MAKWVDRVPENVDGDLFVDRTCIDCDTCRQLAPAIFGESGETSYVRCQPTSDDEQRAATRALLACPTGSIGSRAPSRAREVVGDFPLAIDGPVSYCGFTSPDSFGASSYFLERAGGNWLIDSPRFAAPIVAALAARGGIASIFLSHRDDVAQARSWAERFGARTVVHRDDADAAPWADVVLEGREPVALAPGLTAIPTPGHTRGHQVLLVDDRWLFTGDHFWWSRRRERLIASRSACWYSWAEQTHSMERLLDFRFEWILPGHGERAQRPEMQTELRALVAWMKKTA